MISHIHPWASASLLGGKLQRRYRARPLPGVCGGALGEASGTVSVHLCEQGRPQGASFSAGDLSLHPRDPSRAQPRRRSFPRSEYPALDGTGSNTIEEMNERLETLEQFSDEHENLSQLFAEAHPLTMDGEGRIVLPETLKEHAQITDRCRVCRPRRDVPDLGAGPLRRASRDGARALPPPGHDIAAAQRRGTAARMTRDAAHRTRAQTRRRRRTRSHIPVLLEAVVAALAPRDGATLCRRHVRRRRLQRGAARGGALPRPRHRPRSRGGAPRRGARRAPSAAG